MTIHVKRMWGGGPLRQMADRRPATSWIPYGQTGEYAGPYVCELCEEPSLGVYFVKSESSWLCGPCRELVRPPRQEVRHGKTEAAR